MDEFLHTVHIVPLGKQPKHIPPPFSPTLRIFCHGTRREEVFISIKLNVGGFSHFTKHRIYQQGIKHSNAVSIMGSTNKIEHLKHYHMVSKWIPFKILPCKLGFQVFKKFLREDFDATFFHSMDKISQVCYHML